MTTCVQSWVITLVYVPTVHQQADIFTKPLGGQAFRLHQDVLMLVYTAKLSSSSELVATAGVSSKVSLPAGALSKSSLTVGALPKSQLIKLLAQFCIKMGSNILHWTLLWVKFSPPLQNQTSYWLNLLSKVNSQLDVQQEHLLGKQLI